MPSKKKNANRRHHKSSATSTSTSPLLPADSSDFPTVDTDHKLPTTVESSADSSPLTQRSSNIPPNSSSSLATTDISEGQSARSVAQTDKSFVAKAKKPPSGKIVRGDGVIDPPLDYQPPRSLEPIEDAGDVADPPTEKVSKPSSRSNKKHAKTTTQDSPQKGHGGESGKAHDAKTNHVIRIASTFSPNRALLSTAEPAKAGLSTTNAAPAISDPNPVDPSKSVTSDTHQQAEESRASDVTTPPAQTTSDLEGSRSRGGNFPPSAGCKDSTQSKPSSSSQGTPTGQVDQASSDPDDNSTNHTTSDTIGQREDPKSQKADSEPDSKTRGHPALGHHDSSHRAKAGEGRKHAQRSRLALRGSRRSSVASGSDADDEDESMSVPPNLLEIYLSYFDQDSDGLLEPLDTYHAIRKLGFNALLAAPAAVFGHLLLSPWIGQGTLLAPDMRGRCRIPFKPEKLDDLCANSPDLGNASAQHVQTQRQTPSSGPISPRTLLTQAFQGGVFVDPTGFVRILMGYVIVLALTWPTNLTARREEVEGVYNGDLLFLVADQQQHQQQEKSKDASSNITNTTMSTSSDTTEGKHGTYDSNVRQPPTSLDVQAEA